MRKLSRRQIRNMLLREMRYVIETAQGSVDNDAAKLMEIFTPAIEMYFSMPFKPPAEMTKSAIKEALVSNPIVPTDEIVAEFVAAQIAASLTDKATAMQTAEMIARILAEQKEEMQTDDGRQRTIEAIKEALEAAKAK